MTLCNENAPILVNEEMGCNIWLMTVRAPEIATTARPGQFVHVKVPGMEAHILRRPFGGVRGAMRRRARWTCCTRRSASALST